MKDQQFDNFIKDKLGQYDSGAPIQVWERIREKEKDNKRGFFFFRRYWLTGIALLSLTVISYLSFNSLSGIRNKEQQLTPQSQLNTNSSTAKNQQAAGKSGKELYQQKVSLEKNTSIAQNKANALTESSAKNEAAASNGNNTIVSDGDIHLNTTVSKGSGQARKNIFNLKKEFSNQSMDKKGTGSAIQSENKPQAGGLLQPTEAKEYTLSLSGISTYRSSLTSFQTGNIPQPNNKPNCPTINGPRRNDLYVEIYGSPDYTIRSFSGSSSLNNYISHRRSSEDNRNGFSAGIRLAKNIGEKAVIKAGVNYSQINERLRIINENEKQLTQIITIRTVIRAPGDTLFIRDTTYFEQSGTRYRTTYNRYRFIDLPVIFSYEFGNPEILAFSVNAGPVFNITSFYRGEVLDSTLTPVKISTTKGNGANNWRSNIGIGIFASFAVYKQINERLQIFGEPYFRYNFKPVTQNTNFVNQRYSISGMQLGIRYNLHSGRQRYR